MYVTQTRQSPNERFNSHHSDVGQHPERSYLPPHYNENDYDLRHDLEISVLEHSRGSSEYMKLKNDK